MLISTGVPTNNDILEITPSEERLSKGPVAIIECFQEIPCNPCYSSCPRGAIADMANITERPKIDFDKCNGCGICANACPGLAIFIIDMNYSTTKALVKLPYEFLPTLAEGDLVDTIDREGCTIGQTKVIKVQRFKKNDLTPLIWIAVDKDKAMQVRNVKKSVHNEDDFVYICRCEDVTLSDVKALIEKGSSSIDEIKRLSRCGMGPCGGKTCNTILMNEIAKATNIKSSEIRQSTFRPPAKNIKLGLLAKAGEEK